MANSSNQTDNTTQSAFFNDVDVVSQVVSWLALVVLFSALFVNVLCLYAFYKERSLRTVFNYYLINLTFADIGFACTIPFFFVEASFAVTPLSADVCGLFMSMIWIFSSGAVHTVTLIGFDRLWAVYWPIHYRHNKSKKLTCCIIAAMWVWVILCLLPGIIADRIQTPNATHCDIEMDSTFKQVWGQIVNFTSFLIPIILLIGSYVLIILKLRRTAHKKMTSIADASQTEAAGTELTSNAVMSRVRNKKEKDRRLLRMFGFLTLSIVVFWLPGDTYFPIISFLPDVFCVPLQTAIQLSLYVSTVVNPLVYQLGSNELRMVILRIWCFKQK